MTPLSFRRYGLLWGYKDTDGANHYYFSILYINYIVADLNILSLWSFFYTSERSFNSGWTRPGPVRQLLVKLES